MNRLRGSLKRKLKTSEFCVNVSPYWSKLDNKFLGVKSYCITNGYQEHERFIFADRDADNDRLTTIFIGNFRKYKGIEVLFNGLKKLKESISDCNKRFILKYYGIGYQRFSLFAERYGVKDIVEIHEHVDQKTIQKELSASDIAVLFSTVRKKSLYFKFGFYPGKLFEFIGAGKFILHIGDNNSLAGQLIQKHNLGLSIDNEDDFFEFMTKSLANRRVLDIDYDSSPWSRREKSNELSELLSSHLNIT